MFSSTELNFFLSILLVRSYTNFFVQIKHTEMKHHRNHKCHLITSLVVNFQVDQGHEVKEMERFIKKNVASKSDFLPQPNNFFMFSLITLTSL